MIELNVGCNNQCMKRSVIRSPDIKRSRKSIEEFWNYNVWDIFDFDVIYSNAIDRGELESVEENLKSELRHFRIRTRGSYKDSKVEPSITIMVGSCEELLTAMSIISETKSGTIHSSMLTGFLEYKREYTDYGDEVPEECILSLMHRNCE